VNREPGRPHTHHRIARRQDGAPAIEVRRALEAISQGRSCPRHIHLLAVVEHIQDGNDVIGVTRLEGVDRG
jgi:hypothetical protein